MSDDTPIATVRWERGDAVFTDGRYPRAHQWMFDGLTVPGSSSPAVVRLPLSKPDAVDPEEALAASLSACHMLFVLDFARRGGFCIDVYEDKVMAAFGKTERGKTWISRIALNPAVVFSGDKTPTAEDVAALHDKAHDECFVANSLRSEVVITPSFTIA